MNDFERLEFLAESSGVIYQANGGYVVRWFQPLYDEDENENEMQTEVHSEYRDAIDAAMGGCGATF
jgi:hypothetical protein